MSAPILLSDEEEWKGFKIKFSKSYDSPEDEAKRFQIFQDNLKIIREHNAKYDKGESTYSMGINNFADLTNEEFRSTHLGFGKR